MEADFSAGERATLALLPTGHRQRQSAAGRENRAFINIDLN
jgi:hypothetical protein